MASTPIIDLRPRSVGELLDLTVLLYRRNFLRLIGIALVVLGPIVALSVLGNTGSIFQLSTMLTSIAERSTSGANAGASTLLSTTISWCASGLILIIGIFTPWMEGALTYNVIERVLGRQPNWRESYRAVRPRWGSLWVANVIRSITLYAVLIPFVIGLYGALIGLAFALGASGGAAFGNGNDTGLLFAGVLAICLPFALVGGGIAMFVAASWSMVVPAIVGEGVDGTGALGRSNALVKGDRLRIIGRLLLFEAMRFFVLTLPILAIVLFVIGGAVASTTPGMLSPLVIIGIIISGILNSLETVLVVPFYIIYITVNYLDLRLRKENLALQIQAANMVPVEVAGIVDTGATPVVVASIAQSHATEKVISNPIPQSPNLAVITEVPVREPQTDGIASDPSDIARQPSGPVLTPAQRISTLFKRLRMEADNPDLMNELGLAYQEVGDLFGAQDSFTRARTLAPDNAEYAYNMALLQQRRRDLAGARQAMSDYLRLETDAERRQTALNDPALKDLLT